MALHSAGCNRLSLAGSSTSPSARRSLHQQTALPEFLGAVSLARCCSPCTSHRSVMSSQRMICTTISTPTTRSCTWLFDPELMSLSSPCQNVSMTLRAGSWRMGCFSARLRLKQYCLAPISGVKRFRPKRHWRCRNSGAVSWQCQAAWSYIGPNFDDGPAQKAIFVTTAVWLFLIKTSFIHSRHTSCTQLQLSHTCTATHLATADTRRRQDACPQHRVIAAGLCQCTATRHVGQEPGRLQVAQNSLARVVCQAPVLQMPLSYDSSFTGCRFANELPTIYRWSHTRREPPAPQLTCPI